MHRHFQALSSGQKVFVTVAPTYTTGSPLCLVAHGFAGDANYYNANVARRTDIELLADAGYVVIAADFGGGSTWGNDTFLNSIAEVLSYASTRWGASTTIISWIADSMGGDNCLNYAWRNPASVGFIVMRVPVLNVDAMHDRDPGGLGAAVAAAYTNEAGWDAAKSARDPALNHNLIAPFGPRIRVYYSNNDTVNLLSEATTFVNATGASMVSLGDVAHDETLLYPQINAKSEVAWALSVL